MKWTKDKCVEVALLCKSRTEFRNKYSRGHIESCKNGWIDEICSHMNLNNSNNRCIYSYEFEDNHVYIGLTENLKNRNNRHKNDERSSVNKHIKITNLFPKLIQLTNYLETQKAKEMENFYLQKYKNENWNILNKVKTGSLGGITIIWTKEKCLEMANSCENRSEFWENFPSAANSVKRNCWTNEIHDIIKCKTVERGYWENYENCLKEALKYKSKTVFSKNSPGAYNSSKTNNWYEKICPHMERPKQHNLKWTKEKCQEEALKYNSKVEFQKTSPSSYNKSVKMKWLEDVCSRMERPKQHNLKWTKEKCQEEALNYNRRIDFFNGSPSVYGRCQKQKWLDDVCFHMEPKKLKNYWTKEKCIEEYKKYKTRTEFARGSSQAYNLCLKNNWFDN